MSVCWTIENAGQSFDCWNIYFNKHKNWTIFSKNKKVKELRIIVGFECLVLRWWNPESLGPLLFTIQILQINKYQVTRVALFIKERKRESELIFQCCLHWFLLSVSVASFLPTLWVSLPFRRRIQHRNWSTSWTSCLPASIVFPRYTLFIIQFFFKNKQLYTY